MDDDAVLANRLNEVWDAAVAGRRAVAGLDPAFTRALEELVGHGRSLTPEPTVLARIHQRVANSGGRPRWIVGARHASPGSEIRPPHWGDRATHASPLHPQQQPWRPHVDRGWFAPVATGTMVVLIVAVGLVVFRGWPDADDPARIAAWPVSSPVAESDAPVRFDECVAPPLPEGYVSRLEGNAPELPAEAQQARLDTMGSSLDRLSSLPSASPQVVSELQTTLRLLTACALYDGGPFSELNRYGSLLTDDYRRRDQATVDAYDWRPSPIVPPAIEDSRLLPDGRVLVLLTDELPHQVPGNSGGVNEVVALFAQVDRVWLLDAIIDLDYREPAVLTWDPWSGRRGTFELVLVAAAPGYKPFPDPGFGPSFFMAGGTIRFILYNITGDQRRFFIPELRIDVTVPPYETREFLLPDAVGEFSIRTYTGDVRDQMAPCDGPYPGNTITVYVTPPATSRRVEVASCPSG